MRLFKVLSLILVVATVLTVSNFAPGPAIAAGTGRPSPFGKRAPTCPTGWSAA